MFDIVWLYRFEASSSFCWEMWARNGTKGDEALHKVWVEHRHPAFHFERILKEFLAQICRCGLCWALPEKKSLGETLGTLVSVVMSARYARWPSQVTWMTLVPIWPGVLWRRSTPGEVGGGAQGWSELQCVSLLVIGKDWKRLPISLGFSGWEGCGSSGVPFFRLCCCRVRKISLNLVDLGGFLLWGFPCKLRGFWFLKAEYWPRDLPFRFPRPRKSCDVWWAFLVCRFSEEQLHRGLPYQQWRGEHRDPRDYPGEDRRCWHFVWSETC